MARRRRISLTNETLFGISMSKSEMQFARISLGRWMGGRGQSGSGSGQGREINLDTEERRVEGRGRRWLEIHCMAMAH